MDTQALLVQNIRILSLVTIIFSSLLYPEAGSADCSCQVGTNAISFIGIEYIATSCPSGSGSDNTQYVYLSNAITCGGNGITIFSHWGDTINTPSSLIANYVNNGYRVIRNPSGTHLIVVQAGSQRFNGKVSGVNLSDTPAGVYFTDPQESFNQYCTDMPLPDENNDGVPDCLADQCPDDPNKTAPGLCGCGFPETDGDSDGIIDCIDKKQNEGPPIEASPPSCQSILHDE